MLKQRKDSIEQFTAEIVRFLIRKSRNKSIDKYMPELMSEDAIKEIVTKLLQTPGKWSARHG